MANGTNPQGNQLFLKIRGTSSCHIVKTFDGTSGLVVKSDDWKCDPTVEAELLIQLDNLQPIWSGIIQWEANGNDIEFSMCVKPSRANQSSETIKWSEVPRILNVFDGGYSPLSIEEVGQLLDDLITFHASVRSRAHYEKDGMLFSIDCNFGDQESLKELSEVILDWQQSSNLPSVNQVVILDLEVFELSFFVLGVVAESDSDALIVQLTDHIYSQKKRSGRRIPVSETLVDGYKVLEVCDIGMRIKSTSTNLSTVGSEINLTLSSNNAVRFKVVHSRLTTEGSELGLVVADFRPEARKVWQGFLLRHQYNLLQYRTPEEHEGTWNLLKETKYFDVVFRSEVETLKPSILKEWSLVDSVGPSVGACVLGSESGRLVSTITVSRASSNVWVAQAAAMIDKPEFLPYTRSTYGWRTRFIIQQPDGGFHLAFFKRDKPFLDRFFRKFYLQQGGVNTEDLTWTEWKYYAQYNLNPGTALMDAPSLEPHSVLATEPLLKVLREQQGADTPRVADFGGITVVSGRPYLHLCQYFSSIWISPSFDGTQINLNAVPFGDDNKTYAIRTAREDDQSQISMFKNFGAIQDSGWEVVWLCGRKLLPLFLSNSLRALEIMVRKYGARMTG
jgi:phosphoribulokinase